MSNFEWLNDEARTFLNRGYLVGDITAEERVKEIAETAQRILVDEWKDSFWDERVEAIMKGEEFELPDPPEAIGTFAERFYDYMSKGYYSLASPVWSNFGMDRGLPISCFGSYIGDSLDQIMYTHAEVGMMTKVGGGTSGYFGDIRPRGSEISKNGKSNGTFPFATLFDQLMTVVSQGKTRRGYFAGYIDIDHGDIDEWLNIKHEGCDIQDMMWGVCVSDDWMQSMIDGDKAKRDTWAKVLKSRINFGVPYIFFTDNVAANRRNIYKHQDYEVKASNLCSEVLLPQGPEESFVCCLSSYNVSTIDEWHDSQDVVHTLIYFLDAVMQEFIEKSKGVEFLERAHRFAKRHRAIGAGVLGWHDYLQQNSIPFDSPEAMLTNAATFKYLGAETERASEKLAAWLGEAPVCDGYGMRNATTMAIAPTKSSSFILGQTSPSIEPTKSNYFVRDTAKLKSTYKNPHLEKVLERHGMNTEEVWASIKERDGSVQHLDLPEKQKAVFKTFAEIPQQAIINQAAQRQQFLDQGQSVNVTIDPKQVPVKDINRLYINAWESGVCTLYYQKSVNAAQQAQQDLLSCVSCEA